MASYDPPINSEERYAEFAAALVRAATFNEQSEADQFCLFYETFKREHPDFAAAEPEWAGKYERLYRRAQWIALPLLFDDADIIDLFRNHTDVLPDLTGYDLAARFQERLITLALPERDSFKEKIKEALAGSEVSLGAEFTSSVTGARQQGTVGNWIKEFQGTVGKSFADSLAQARFYSEHKAFTALEPAARAALQALIGVFARCNLSSRSAEGFEEDRLIEVKGELMEYRAGGALEAFDPALTALLKKIRPRDQTPTRSREELLRERFADPPALAAALKSAEDLLRKKSDRSPRALRDALYAALVPPGGGAAATAPAVAALRALAATGGIPTLTADPRFQEFVKAMPASPEPLRNLMRAIFQKLLGMDESEAARHILYLANLMKNKANDDQLMGAVAFDERARGFRFVAARSSAKK